MEFVILLVVLVVFFFGIVTTFIIIKSLITAGVKSGIEAASKPKGPSASEVRDAQWAAVFGAEPQQDRKSV